MRWMVAVAALALYGCSSAGKSAEDEYRIVERTGGDAEKCDAARAVAQGYLRDKNEAQYRNWKLTADINCNLLALKRAQGG